MNTKVLLVGWDSADWKIINPLMDRGELPMVRKLVESGVMGNLATLEPILSPMLWTSIATGKRAYDHGVLGFTEVNPVDGRVKAVTAGTRRCKALWNILAERGLRSHVVGWFATHGEQIPGGSVVSDLFSLPTAGPGRPWPAAPRGTIWPEEMAAELNDLRVSPEEIDPGLVGLFVPEWEKIDQTKDRRLGHLRRHLAECLSVQAAATWVLEHRPWDFVAVYFRAIDELSHHFMPFHPPKLDGVPQEQFELYQHVVTGTYRFHDLMLARLIALAGPDVHVILVSDHGFHSDHLRPKFVPRVPAGITVWHRPYGILAAHGPQFLEDELIHGASLLDVTPTVLTLFGLPTAQDMEGKVLLQALRRNGNNPLPTIPSWESSASELVTLRSTTALSAEESRTLVEQFAALGYIDKPSDDPSEHAAATLRENNWTLARAYLDGQRPRAALPLLEELSAAVPHRTDFAQTLARSQIQLGLLAEAQATIDAAVATFSNEAMSHLLRAQIAFGTKHYDAAIAHLDATRAAGGQSPQFWQLLGQVQLKQRQWAAAREAFSKVLEAREDDALAWLGMAICHLRERRPRRAITAALNAVGLEFNLPRAHLVLGVACVHLGRFDRAEQALSTALRFAPKLARAHHFLSILYDRQGRHEEADSERRARMHILAERRRREATIGQLRDEMAERSPYLTEIRAAATARIAAQKAARAAQTQSEACHSEREVQSAPAGMAELEAGLDLPVLDLVIVSGLPRSGTSLMMQLLEAGGYPVMTDGVRTADANNERGYYEWEAARKLLKNPALIEQTAGKAVKVISALLPALPRRHRYKVVFVMRPLSEVARSQHKMRFRHEGEPAELAKVVPLLEKHRAAVLNLLRNSPSIELLEVDYPELVSNPHSVIDVVIGFLGADRFTTPAAMAAVVDARLCHNRTDANAE